MGRFDRGLALLLVVLAAFFTFRTPAWGKFDPLPTGPRAGLGYLAIALVAIALLAWLVRRESRLPRILGRLIVGAFAVLAVSMAVSRFRLWRGVERQVDPWPPRLDRLAAVDIDSLPSAARANWAARIASHAALDGGRPSLPIRVPADWPFPSDAQVATRWEDSTELEVWARVPDGTATCVPILLATNLRADSLARRARCAERTSAPEGLAFVAPVRSRPIPAEAVAMGDRPAWPEYRADAARTDIVAGTTATDRAGNDGWQVAIDGPIRASASASGELLLVGAHRTGSLTALDARTGAVRWIARVPNWIHQDPVTDGTIVVVGFGDNLDAFAGRAPSGVAAYVLATGERLWTAFDQGSVMTSPVIAGDAIVYGTGAGLLRRRDLATGTLLAADTLPGTVTMAPPVLIGDTVVFSLDHGRACAILASTLERRWCGDLPDLRLMGHAAPAVYHDLVIVSGVATVLTPTLAEFRRMGRRLQWRLIRSVLFPGEYETYSGQVYAALDLHDGHLRWRSPLYAEPRLVVGHIAGTATIRDTTAVIVLPVSDTVVAFDPRTGARRWARPGHAARGPALILDDQVIVAGRDGVILSWALANGAARCRVERPVGFDRAGPTPVAGELVFLRLDGIVEAIRLADLAACRGDGMTTPDRDS